MSALATKKRFDRLMTHYRGDQEKQFQLMLMSERDILEEYINVFGMEGGIYE